MRRPKWIPAWLGFALAVVAAGLPGCGGGGASRDPRELRVMTRNLYLGAELGPVIEAVAGGDPDGIVLATSEAFAAVVATDFPTRAEAIADEIVAASPDVVGLQEAALWRVQSPSDTLDPSPTSATDVAYDFVALLLDALARRGLDFVVVAEAVEADVELPALDESMSLMDVRFTDRDVLLARGDLVANGAVYGGSSGLFDTFLDLGGGLVVPRGWVAADVRVAGRTVRVVSTHLEDASEDLQRAQATELLAGPLAGDGMAVLLGDLNSDANALPPGATYLDVTAAGFIDAWLAAGHGAGTGATWGHDAALTDPDASLSQRLDLVLVRGALSVRSADVHGDDPGDMQGGLWPSDHAGLSVVLRR
ncbi:MAG: endonuclease/exonuclease/phosphatase family protein [Planctomycetes bacterium]|nr:endonuclease/exonuclease/phosphatase family protein [Planctomycetota bacterium]